MYRVNNKDFKILQKYDLFLQKLDMLLENVPRKDYFYKDKIREEALGVHKNILRCTEITEGKVLAFFKAEVNVGICELDVLIDRLYKKKYISEKGAYELASYLIEVKKMFNGLVRSIVQDECKLESTFTNL